MNIKVHLSDLKLLDLNFQINLKIQKFRFEITWIQDREKYSSGSFWLWNKKQVFFNWK